MQTIPCRSAIVPCKHNAHTGGASNDGSFGLSKTRTAMIVKRPYLKRHMENTSSTSSISFSYESDTMRHTPLVGFSS